MTSTACMETARSLQTLSEVTCRRMARTPVISMKAFQKMHLRMKMTQYIPLTATRVSSHSWNVYCQYHS